MKSARAWLLAASMIAGVQPALAKAPVPPVPQGSPGDWVRSADYPLIALRFEMTGATGFSLTVDATGRSTRCDIVSSSGFDVLDTATCQRLMVSARFTPARDRAGTPIEGTWSNRVRWVLPDAGANAPVTEGFRSLLMTIDEAGEITSCRAAIHIPVQTAVVDQNWCEEYQSLLSRELALKIRGDFRGASAEVEIQYADAFSPQLRGRVLSPKPGYEQRALSIHRFKVLSGGTLGPCGYEEQRGNEELATAFCLFAAHKKFDPPFSALDKDGVASGWHIDRVLLKTGK